MNELEHGQLKTEGMVLLCSCGGEFKVWGNCKCSCMEYTMKCNKCGVKASWIPECAWKRRQRSRTPGGN